MGSLVCLLGQVHAGAEPRGWLDVLRHDVAPVASAYLVFVIMLAAHARSRRRPRLESEHRRTVRWRRTPDPPDPGWRELFAYVLGTAIGGYAVFLFIILTYYLALGGENRRFLIQAFREGSALTFAIVVPGFLVVSWLYDAMGPGRRNPGGASWRGSRTTGSDTS